MNFSRRGQPATIFEAQLVAEAVISAPDRDLSRWVLIAQAIGVDNLVKVLDEFGTEKVHFPSHEQFFQMLYRPVRNQQIRDMRNRTGASLRDIGADFGCSHAAVQRALASTADDA